MTDWNGLSSAFANVARSCSLTVTVAACTSAALGLSAFAGMVFTEDVTKANVWTDYVFPVAIFGGGGVAVLGLLGQYICQVGEDFAQRKTNKAPERIIRP
jgi:hypothetical protein